MVKIAVLIDRKKLPTLFDAPTIARLESLGQVRWHRGDVPIKDDEAVALLAGCAVGIGSWGTPGPTGQIVPRCPDLRLWVHAAGSVKHFFGPHLDGREITIASCAPAIATTVAEAAVGELVIGLRRLLENARANRDGGRPPVVGAVPMADAVIGVLGASTVGREVIRILKPFRSRVLVYDPFLTPAGAAELGVERAADLIELCRACDAVTMHTPALPATRHMMGAAQFAAMRDGAVFVNTSRGMCVDEGALVAELQKGRITAFLDVSDPEPAADDSPLRRLANCSYTSHIAGGPSRGIGRQAVADVAAFLSGGRPAMVVTKDMLERMA